MNIILIGMPGVGKTCMGKSLASKLKYKHVDTDRIIEIHMNKKLHKIMDEYGLDGFKKIENEVLCSVDLDNTVISTGGSAVYHEEGMKHLKEIGTVVYLYAELKTILHRLGDFSTRGIAMKDGQTIEDLYRERSELYERYADITVDCSSNEYTAHRNKIISLLNI